jgi:hypothetical protein
MSRVSSVSSGVPKISPGIFRIPEDRREGISRSSKQELKAQISKVSSKVSTVSKVAGLTVATFEGIYSTTRKFREDDAQGNPKTS